MAAAGHEQRVEGGSIGRVLGFLRALFARSRRGEIGAAAVLVPLGFVVEGAGLLLLIPILSLVLEPDTPTRWPIVAELLAPLSGQSAGARIGLLLALFVALMLLRGAILHARDHVLARLQVHFIERLRIDALEDVTRAPWHRLARIRHGQVVTLLSSDLATCGAAAHFAIQALVAGFVLAGYIALMLIVSAPLAAAALGLLGATALFLMPIVRHALATGSAMSRANLAMADALVQFLGGLKFAKSLGEAGGFLGRLRADQHALSGAQLDYLVRQSRARVILTTVFALAGAALLYVALFGFGLGAPAAITQLLLVSRLGAPALQVQQGTHNLVASVPAFERIERLRAELAPRGAPAAGPAPAIRKRPEIQFDRVGFAHEGDTPGAPDRPILEDVSFAIAPGELVGLSGPSGAGKSTLADLLSGLLVASAGEIWLGGVRLDAASAEAWAARVSYVPQEAFLLNDSLRTNLLWGAGGSDEAAIRQALDAVGATARIEQMGGLDAPVGERGNRLSGGERQRIALARALLRGAELIILDEATNALDAASEAQLLARIAALKPRPTVLLISHSEAVLGRCERVLFLDRGRLIGDRRPG